MTTFKITLYSQPFFQLQKTRKLASLNILMTLIHKDHTTTLDETFKIPEKWTLQNKTKSKE